MSVLGLRIHLESENAFPGSKSSLFAEVKP